MEVNISKYFSKVIFLFKNISSSSLHKGYKQVSYSIWRLSYDGIMEKMHRRGRKSRYFGDETKIDSMLHVNKHKTLFNSYQSGNLKTE